MGYRAIPPTNKGIMKLSTIDEAIEAIRRGDMIIVMDDENRENEGDFICAAEDITPEKVNFMLKYGRGQTCVPMLPQDCARLDLPQMVLNNTAPLSTQFTIAVDHRDDRTGITAPEKAKTIKALSDPKSKPSDFARPGHVFPLQAKEGGVLRRAGHTEASIDLMRLAGKIPCGVLTEILDEDGDRAHRDRLAEIAEEHKMILITIEDLIRYRRRREKLVKREAEAFLPTKFGVGKIMSYSVQYEDQEPCVVVFGEPDKVEAPLVRIHSSCFTGDILGSLRCDCGDQLQESLKKMGEEGTGVLVYLPQEGRGIGLAEKIKAYKLQDEGLDTVDANLALGFAADLRDYGIGLQILKDLNIHKIRLLTNNPKKVDAFIYGGFDIEVVDQIPILAPVNEFNRHYLETKRDRMGHKL